MPNPLKSRSRSRILPPPGILSQALAGQRHDMQVPPTAFDRKMAIAVVIEHILCARLSRPATHNHTRIEFDARATLEVRSFTQELKFDLAD